jgi:hypothetical protein
MVSVNVPSVLGPKVENWRGKIDESFYEPLMNEGINYDSGKVWITFKADNFKGKGVYTTGNRQISRGRIIITVNRFIAIVAGHKLIDVPKDHPWFKEIVIDDSNPERFNIELDLKKFPNEFEGFISLGYHINPKDVKKWF